MIFEESVFVFEGQDREHKFAQHGADAMGFAFFDVLLCDFDGMFVLFFGRTSRLFMLCPTQIESEKSRDIAIHAIMLFCFTVVWCLV